MEWQNNRERHGEAERQRKIWGGRKKRRTWRGKKKNDIERQKDKGHGAAEKQRRT